MFSPVKMLSAVVMTLFAHFGTDAQCIHGWVRHGLSCYGFGEELVTWAGASALCRIFDGALVEIETSEENEFLKTHARNYSEAGVWIGGTDVFSEGGWEWATSKRSFADGFTDWGWGEPNHAGGDTNEDCLQLYAHKNYQWNDEDCNLHFPFVCEVHIEEEPNIG